MEDPEITFVRHIRDSSRLNAQALRRLAEDPARDQEWLTQRAREIDNCAEVHDEWLRSHEVTDK